MGCTMSSPTSGRRVSAFEGVRVIHINGYVEEFVGGGEVTVGDVTGRLLNVLLCASGRLCPTGFKPLPPAGRLEPGSLYFLLPNSVLQSDATPMDHAALSARLTALAFDRATPVDVRLVQKVAAGVSPTRGRSCGAKSWRPALESIDEKS